MTIISLVGQTPVVGEWAQFGVLGAVIGALFWIVVNMQSSHREERKEWRDDANIRSEKTDIVINELTKAIRETK